MGTTISYIRYKLNELEERLSLRERDYMNLYEIVQNNKHGISKNSKRCSENYKHILSISLLEEGRSIYNPTRKRSRVSHTASTYNF